MGCNCGSKRNGNANSSSRYTVTLPGGIRITKNTEAEARTFAGKHPGATVAKKTG